MAASLNELDRAIAHAHRELDHALERDRHETLISTTSGRRPHGDGQVNVNAGEGPVAADEASADGSELE